MSNTWQSVSPHTKHLKLHKNTGLCCAIIWTLFSVFENVLNCCCVFYDQEIEVKVMRIETTSGNTGFTIFL